jgi:hypothetical protein
LLYGFQVSDGKYPIDPLELYRTLLTTQHDNVPL